MKILFMGTPEFSVRALETLVEAGHEVVAVVTQPDKSKGRGGKVSYTPVKEKALELSIPVFQPERVKDADFMNVLRELEPEVIVVIAFGQLLPREVLEYPKYGCINIHASLLPKYRGAAPIQWVIVDGEKETGVTTMQMDVGLDTGDMIDKIVVPIEDKETGGSLHDKLMEAGANLIIETLKKVEMGTAKFEKQDDEKSCYAKMLTKQLGDIDFTNSAIEIERLIRGLNPWPSAYTKLNGKTLKIWDADVIDEDSDRAPGTIYEIDGLNFKISTGKGALVINELQLEGKRRMKAADFLRGYKLDENTVLG